MPTFKVEWQSTNSNPNPMWSVVNANNFDAAIKEVKRRQGKSIRILSVTPVEPKFPG
jgi:hypothetical protein